MSREPTDTQSESEAGRSSADQLPHEGEGLDTMSVPLDNLVLSLELRGWRDRSTGMLHLDACSDFHRLDAEQIEDAVWRPEERYARLCPVCFPPDDDQAPEAHSASESHEL